MNSKELIHAYKNGDEFHIEIPKGTNESELSFVITRALYFMVQTYADDTKISFEEALKLYEKAIANNIQIQYDLENKDGQL
mgnify:FL=1